MTNNPLGRFVAEGRTLTDLYGSADPIADDQLTTYMVIQKRIAFLRDLISRVAIIAYCYDQLIRLAEAINDLHVRRAALPPTPERPNTQIIPPEMSEEEEQRLVEADAFTSLIYYEVTSLVGMLLQLGVTVTRQSELQYLVKVRDRFLSHGQLSGLARSADRGWVLPDRGFLRRDAVSLSVWSSTDLRALGNMALIVGSPAWTARRQANETLVLSSKRSEKFTEKDLQSLAAAGVRECDVELALHQLGGVLTSDVLPIIDAETNLLIEGFGWGRWSSVAGE